MKLTIIAAVALVQLVHGQLRTVVNFPKCKKNDPNLTECILNSIEIMRPILIEGIPEIEFPRLEPFIMDKIPLDSTLLGFKLKGEVTNVVAHGAGNFHISNFKIDYEKNTADVTVVIPKLEVTADYAAQDSSLIGFNVQSTGKFTGTFVDVVTTIHIRGRLDDETDDGGKVYLKVPYVQVQIDFGSETTYKIEPTEVNFTGKVLGKLLNFSPKRLLLDMMKSDINKTAAQIIKQYLNVVLDKLPLEDVLE